MKMNRQISIASNKGGEVEDIRELDIESLEFHLHCVLIDQVSIEAQLAAAEDNPKAKPDWEHKATIALKHKRADAELIRQVIARKRKEINARRNAEFGSMFMICAKKYLDAREYQEIVNMARAEMANGDLT